jgi:hypothetical protein
MSVRIETLGTRARSPQTAWLVLIAGLLALVAMVTLLSRVAPDTRAPVRPPAVATSVRSAPGAAIKAVANDPYLRAQPSENATSGVAGGVTKVSIDEPRFGPNFNMGRACPKCW